VSERLEAALIAHRNEVEQALEAAEGELAALNLRKQELEELIEHARATLGLPESSIDDRLRLHEAIAHVLRENRNDWMEAKDIAHHVNRQRLYERQDGGPVESNQIQARVNRYPRLFEKNGSRIRMRVNDDAMQSP
jgi:multidrug resistance efflux pump